MAFRFADPQTADGATPGWIVADGEVTPESATIFRSFLTTNKDRWGARSVVLLNSQGGSLFGGVALGEAIREFGLGTRIGRSNPDPSHRKYVTESEGPGQCLSACAFAFLGGKSRTASDQTLGVHQHYSEEMLHEPAAKQFTAGDLSAQQIIGGILTEYVVRMGVDARFLTRASMTQPRSMYLFSVKEMDGFNITLDDRAFSEWKLEPYKGGVVASSQSHNGVIATLFCRSDKFLRLLIDTAYSGDGNDVDELIKGAVIDLFGMEIPAADIKGKVTRGRAALEFKLPSQIAAGKLEQPSGMGALGATRQFFYFALPAKDFGIYARLANRNCI